MIEIHFKISSVKFLMHMLKKEILLAYAVVIVQPLRLRSKQSDRRLAGERIETLGGSQLWLKCETTGSKCCSVSILLLRNLLFFSVRSWG